MINQNTEFSVSPVVGVMLMLVVTIIIAAVVSAFAGGMASSEKKVPQATFSSSVNLGDGIEGTYVSSTAGYTYPAGYTCENNYILFEHKGGDSFDLSDIEVVLQNGDNKMTFGPGDEPNSRSGWTCRNDPANAAYFSEVGAGSDGFINPGDKFTLTFDANYYRAAYDMTYLSFLKEDATNGMGFPVNKKVQYMIVDRTSGKAIQSGELIAKVTK